jgi:hypothetical protein
MPADSIGPGLIDARRRSLFMLESVIETGATDA